MGYLDGNIEFEHDGTHTLLSLYLSKFKDIKLSYNPYRLEFGCFLLELYKNQLSDKKGDCYIRKNDQRIIDPIFINGWLQSEFLDSCLSNGYLDANTTFVIDRKEHTLLSLCLSKIDLKKDTVSGHDCGRTLRKKLLEASKAQLTETKYAKHCYIIKNDPRIMRIALSAIDKKCFNFLHDFCVDCYKNEYLDFNKTFKNNGKSHTFLSLCLSVLKDKPFKEDDSLAYLVCFMLRASKDQLSDEYTESCYIKKNDQRIIDVVRSAIHSSIFSFAYNFLQECVFYKYLDTNITFSYNNKEYTFFSFYLSVLKEQMESITAQERFHARLFGIFLLEKCIDQLNDEMQGDCYIKKNDPRVVDALSILVPQDVSSCNFFSSCFYKYLDNNIIFSYNNKCCTPLSLCAALWQDCEDLEKLRRKKSYFEDHPFGIWQGNYVLKWTQGTQYSCGILDFLKQRADDANALIYKRYEPLLNRAKFHREKIRLQILREYVTCIDIIKMMQYYQE